MNLSSLAFDPWAAVPAVLVASGVFAALLLKRRTGAMPGPRTRSFAADTSAETRPGETRPQDMPGLPEADEYLNPLTEAEVFMSLGRDREAEELLLDAIRRAPTRLSLRVKLAEIYAKRPDPVAFQSVAFKLRLITGARGIVWDAVCRMGREVDRTNPEYRNMTAASRSSAFSITRQHEDDEDFAETMLSEPAPLARRTA